MCLPIKNFQDRVIAIVELVNRRAANKKNPVSFSRDQASTLAPVTRVLSGYIERTDNLEQIASRNIKLRQRNRALAKQRTKIADLQEATEDAFKLSISLLARATEIYDEGTGNHILRVNEYSYFLAEELGMPRAFCDEIRYSAQLHDVGKMVVDAAVLKKGGKLTRPEREEMNKHPIYGYQILSHSPRLKRAAEIALFHHEKWDGSGYRMASRARKSPSRRASSPWPTPTMRCARRAPTNPDSATTRPSTSWSTATTASTPRATSTPISSKSSAAATAAWAASGRSSSTTRPSGAKQHPPTCCDVGFITLFRSL